MTLIFALGLAADHYRDGSHTDTHARTRIAEIRALVWEYLPNADPMIINLLIPPYDVQVTSYPVDLDIYLPA